MPLTFSASSFSFLKSSTTSQSNIEQNNTVDNVNKSNININDNLDFGNNSLNERKVRSLDISTSFKNNNRRNSNASGNLKNSNRKWLKSIFVRFLSRWNDGNDDDDDNNNNMNLNNISNLDDNNLVKNNEINNDNDDGIIMMKTRRSIAVENQKNAFVHHGNTHDFYIVTKGALLKSSHHHPSQPITSELKKHPSSSVFEKCAKTPRHYAKETEVLGTVGRFTILREREDFNTTYFDTCHCQQKPCRFPINGGCGTHPISPEFIPNENDDSPPIFIPTQRSIIASSRNLTQQQAAAIAYQQVHMQMANSRTIYCHPTPSTSSRRSLPSLQKHTATNVMASKATASSTTSSSSSSICVLPQSASSPNLVHLNQRFKNENKNNSTRMSNNGRPIILCNNSGKYHHHPQSTATSLMKAKKPSLVNIKATESELRRLSMPSTITSTSQSSINHSSAPSTPTSISKFPLSHNNNNNNHHHHNEPHTTINSHSGRKFEVEWTCSSTTLRSSTSSTSSTSSSEPASSPPSSISSMASSPDQSTRSSTLSRRCSTLSSKCGRKFEVTILSSSTSSTNGLYTTSPHSTINSVISLAETTAESTKV